MKGDKGDEIIVEVPSKTIHIQHARCPNGCDLMDSTVLIEDFPSIKVMVTHGIQRGAMNLDPLYGGYKNISEIDIPDDEVVEFYCPHCGVSLVHDDETCHVCSSPMFTLHLPHGGLIEGCLRRGCFEHRLKIVDLGAQFLRIYQQGSLDAYL